MEMVMGCRRREVKLLVNEGQNVEMIWRGRLFPGRELLWFSFGYSKNCGGWWLMMVEQREDEDNGDAEGAFACGCFAQFSPPFGEGGGRY